MNRSSPVGMMLQYAFGRGPSRAGSSSGPASPANSDITCDLSPQMLALAAPARAWWEAGRPEGWSLEQHLAAPTAGCSACVLEQALAEAVACLERQGV
ncbi:hypothetical protein [Azohydromonas aeria]|uniref:hypothetical protein n=1 Tax=Azohydromonas aeria TaxID=2590212 RepID=UPI0012FAF19E|nr:hypothetical protein [Azohydromonas aeria]